MIVTQAIQEVQAELSLGPTHEALIVKQIDRALLWMAQKLFHLEKTVGIRLLDGTATYALSPYRILRIRHAFRDVSSDTYMVKTVDRIDMVGPETLRAPLDQEIYISVVIDPSTTWPHILHVYPTPTEDDNAASPSLHLVCYAAPAEVTVGGLGDEVETGGPQFEELLLTDVKRRMCQSDVIGNLKLAKYWKAEREEALVTAQAARQTGPEQPVRPVWL